MKLLKNKKGVTLAELLAVITIMGIIAAIAVPAISNAISRSREEAAKGDAIAIFEGASIYCRVSNNCPNSGTETHDIDTVPAGHPVAAYVDRIDPSVDYTIEFSNGAPAEVTVTLDATNYPGLSAYSVATFDGTLATIS